MQVRQNCVKYALLFRYNLKIIRKRYHSGPGPRYALHKFINHQAILVNSSLLRSYRKRLYRRAWDLIPNYRVLMMVTEYGTQPRSSDRSTKAWQTPTRNSFTLIRTSPLRRTLVPVSLSCAVLGYTRLYIDTVFGNCRERNRWSIIYIYILTAYSGT